MQLLYNVNTKPSKSLLLHEVDLFRPSSSSSLWGLASAHVSTVKLFEPDEPVLVLSCSWDLSAACGNIESIIVSCGNVSKCASKWGCFGVAQKGQS